MKFVVNGSYPIRYSLEQCPETKTETVHFEEVIEWESYSFEKEKFEIINIYRKSIPWFARLFCKKMPPLIAERKTREYTRECRTVEFDTIEDICSLFNYFQIDKSGTCKEYPFEIKFDW